MLVTLIQLVDRIPLPSQPDPRRRGHPLVYSDRLFLKALVIMIVRHLHKVNELLSVLTQPTVEMATLRNLLSEQGRFPSRRTWERRLKAIPSTKLTQLGCLGRHLIDLIQPWASCGRAVAIDSTVLRAQGGVWHQKHREKASGLTPRLTPRPIGRNLAGTAGNCMSSPPWLPCGFPSQQC